MSRELQTKICREKFETACNKGCSAVNKQYYVSCKLHLAVSLNGVYKQMDITKASVHNIGYLNDIKPGSMKNCTCLAYAGQVSDPYQPDLFESVQINFETQCVEIKKGLNGIHTSFKNHGKELKQFSLNSLTPFMMKRNYATTCVGLASRIYELLPSE